MNNVERWKAQGELQPGEEGYWKVWGASYRDIRPGDIIAVKSGLKDSTDPVSVYEVAETKEWLPGIGIVTPDGEEIGIGGLMKLVVVRWGTKNTLSEYVR